MDEMLQAPHCIPQHTAPGLMLSRLFYEKNISSNADLNHLDGQKTHLHDVRCDNHCLSEPSYEGVPDVNRGTPFP